MNESDFKERVSAFVDGEIDGPARDRVVEALYASNELRRVWERFHVIGDAMRKVGPVPGAEALSQRVSSALPIERIAPRGPRSRSLAFGPLPGLALAASVAAVAILGIRSLDDGRGMPSGLGAGDTRQKAETVNPAPSEPIAPALHIASTAGQGARAELAGLQWSDVAPDAEARLNAYLVSHYEHAGHGVRGLLPYVRVVGYQPAAGDYR